MLRLGGLVAAATYSHPQHTYNSVWQVTPLKERQQNSSNGEKMVRPHENMPKTFNSCKEYHNITQLPIQEEYRHSIWGYGGNFVKLIQLKGTLSKRLSVAKCNFVSIVNIRQCIVDIC